MPTQWDEFEAVDESPAVDWNEFEAAPVAAAVAEKFPPLTPGAELSPELRRVAAPPGMIPQEQPQSFLQTITPPVTAPRFETVKGGPPATFRPTGIQEIGEEFKKGLTGGVQIANVKEYPATMPEKVWANTINAPITAAFGEEVATQIPRSLANQGIGLADFVTSPLGIATAAGGAVSKAARIAAGLYFTKDLSQSVIEQAKQAGLNWDAMTPPEKADAIVTFLATGAMATGVAKHTGTEIGRTVEAPIAERRAFLGAPENLPSPEQTIESPQRGIAPPPTYGQPPSGIVTAPAGIPVEAPKTLPMTRQETARQATIRQFNQRLDQMRFKAPKPVVPEGEEVAPEVRPETPKKELASFDDFAADLSEKVTPDMTVSQVQEMYPGAFRNEAGALVNKEGAKALLDDALKAKHPIDWMERQIDSGKAPTSNDAYEVGLKVRTIEDLEKLAKLRERITAQVKKNKKFSKAFAMQLPVEAIEAATFVSKKTDPRLPDKRPLDVRSFPEVREWLLKNADRFGESYAEVWREALGKEKAPKAEPKSPAVEPVEAKPEAPAPAQPVAKSAEATGAKGNQAQEMTPDERAEHSKLKAKDLTEDGLSKSEEQRLFELNRKETRGKRSAQTQKESSSLREAGVVIPNEFYNPSEGVENHITGWTRDKNGFIQIRVESHTAGSVSAKLITVKPGDTVHHVMNDAVAGTTRYSESQESSPVQPPSFIPGPESPKGPAVSSTPQPAPSTPVTEPKLAPVETKPVALTEPAPALEKLKQPVAATTEMVTAEGTGEIGQGPGAMTRPRSSRQEPAETGGEGTGLKKAIEEIERASIGLPPMSESEIQAMAPAWIRAGETLAKDPDAGRKLVQALESDPTRAVSGDEAALLLRHKASLLNRMNDAAERTITGTPEAKAEAQAEYEVLKSEFEALIKTVKETASVAGRRLRWQQALAYEDFSFATQERLLAAAKGRPLTDVERINLFKQIEEYKKRIAELEKHQSESKDKTGPAKKKADAKEAGIQVEIDIAKEKINQERFKAEQAHRTLPRKIWDGIQMTRGAIVNLVSSYDFSAPRQAFGAILSNVSRLITSPVEAGKMLAVPFQKMFQAWANEKTARVINKRIQMRPNALSGADKIAGIEYSDISTNKFTKHEENAHSIIDQWAEQPLIPSKSIGSIVTLPVKLASRGVRMSNRAFTTFLNVNRAMLFDHLLKINFKDRAPTDVELKVIGNMVNIATGRGKISPMTSRVASEVIWAPKLLTSRLQFLAGQPLWGAAAWKGSGRARKIIAKEYARTIAAGFLLYKISQMFNDKQDKDKLTSTDAGKIVRGNTRIDPWGGYQQVTVLAARTLSGKTTTLKGDERDIGAARKYGQRGVWYLWADFLRSKLRPDVGVVVDVATRTDFIGRPTTVPHVVESTLIPLPMRDITDIMKENGFTEGMIIEALGLFGAGTSYYDDKTKTRTFSPSR